MRLILSCLFFVLFFVNKINSQSCAPATAMIDLHANQVKATLLNGGDMWWDTKDGAYIVPYRGPNEHTPSSLFAGAIWMGGFHPGGNLVLAAKAYGSASRQSDFYPGPLNQFTGTTDSLGCKNWDRFFSIRKSETDKHLLLLGRARMGEINYTEDLIPLDVKEWPAKGNPFFEDIYGFELPGTPQGLADFWDENGDGIYNPLDGDYPALIQRGCNMPSIPEQMVFWIFNDGGGIHTESTADPMHMEFQVTAFAYNTDDAFDFATFYKYKMVYRAREDLSNAYFGLWMDPQLGCFIDDYMGCDTTRDMAYLYNKDSIESPICMGGVNSFPSGEIPMVGFDYFQGPLNKDGLELGMSSFTFYNNPTVGTWPGGTTDPQTGEQYYNYLTGKIKTGQTAGINGYEYPSAPDCTDPDCYSMCSENLGESDRRSIQAIGPMSFSPGDVQELILGVVWTGNVDHPCPSLDKLTRDDDFIQTAFDNCLVDISPTNEYRSTPLEAIVLSPNPFSKTNHVELTISNLPQKSTIRIFGINGKVVKNIGRVDSPSINWTPDFLLSGGVYFVEVRDQYARKVLKWVYSK